MLAILSSAEFHIAYLCEKDCERNIDKQGRKCTAIFLVNYYFLIIILSILYSDFLKLVS